MSKRGYLSRYMLIVKKLRLMPFSSFEEIRGYLENHLEFLQMQDDELNIGNSKRTFQRDIREIRNLFGVDIVYSHAEKGYYISQGEMENMNFQRMIESFDMFNTLSFARDLEPYIHIEKRKPQGTENLFGLLHAIRNRHVITFRYHKYWDDEISQRKVNPYALMEFSNRWYLIAMDLSDKNIKSFALDRLSSLGITGASFSYPKKFNVEEMYRYCFGIISANDDRPEDVVLSFDPHQGKYIKSLPLHETQEIIEDNHEELRIMLKVFITKDFVMELLSHGDSVKVIRPNSLIDELKMTYTKCLELYKQDE